jgi:hypothetical protein
LSQVVTFEQRSASTQAPVQHVPAASTLGSLPALHEGAGELHVTLEVSQEASSTHRIPTHFAAVTFRLEHSAA